MTTFRIPLQAASETPSEMVLEGLNMSKLKIVEREAVTKSQKGRKARVVRKVGECCQWKAIGQCSKGDSCSFSHDPASGSRRDQRQEGHLSCTKSEGTD